MFQARPNTMKILPFNRPKTPAEIRVLSIDGGGVRGLIPALFLKALEEQIGRPLTQVFDVFTGTSSGSISAFGLSTGLYQAKDLPEMFKSTARQIFHLRRLSRLGARGGVFGPKYQVKNFEAVINETFGDVTMGQLEKPTVAPTFNLATRAATYFSSVPGVSYNSAPEAVTLAQPQRTVAEVIRASSSAPIFFEPAQIPSDPDDPNSERLPLVDGGLVANNPSLLGATLAKHLHDLEHPRSISPRIRVVSLSTDSMQRPLAYRRAANWGIFDWLRPVTTALMQAQNDMTDTALNLLNADVSYERIAINWDNAPNSTQVARFTDNASEANLQAIEDATLWSIEDQWQRLGEISFRLLGERKLRQA